PCSRCTVPDKRSRRPQRCSTRRESSRAPRLSLMVEVPASVERARRHSPPVVRPTARRSSARAMRGVQSRHCESLAPEPQNAPSLAPLQEPPGREPQDHTRPNGTGSLESEALPLSPPARSIGAKEARAKDPAQRSKTQGLDQARGSSP